MMRSALPDSIPLLLGPAMVFPPQKQARSTPSSLNLVSPDRGGGRLAASTITGTPFLWAISMILSNGSPLGLVL